MPGARPGRKTSTYSETMKGKGHVENLGLHNICKQWLSHTVIMYTEDTPETHCFNKARKHRHSALAKNTWPAAKRACDCYWPLRETTLIQTLRFAQELAAGISSCHEQAASKEHPTAVDLPKKSH